MLSEPDLKLVDALQTDPRAPWSVLGDALGIGAVTAARRWEALVSRGYAWLTAYPGGELVAKMVLAFAELDCEPGETVRIAHELAADPQVATVEHLAGHCDLRLHLLVPTLRDLSDYVLHRLTSLPGVRTARTVLAPRMFAEGSRWRVRAISPVEREALTGRASRPTAPLRFSELDRALILALGEDVRASAASLALRLGVGATTVRRRLETLLSHGAVRLRCEIARPLSPAPVTAMLWLRVPPDKLETTARSLATLPEVRLCAALTGTANLLVVVWLSTHQDAVALEGSLATKLPWMEVVDRAVTLRSIKLMGHLLDESGLAAGRVPLDFWSVPKPPAP
ncbi:Lrp/AsnC family transcriptional regulator [Amycolatopsis jiangsuensis]|uniref:DNA-binding Lrp family transcriptional regulator n=1 Tax=Amycolatopsis jiangsuensis TaxID=1181879 RepID=A0A840ISI2_9PSEU|nr:AsnC family transcriptional regulator [Amycolatopsis jiangsuensis]MBB4684850.1 DNA-binding Lrp family transcriptional regulator [Amycolatopsis jiangsuensis]